MLNLSNEMFAISQLTKFFNKGTPAEVLALDGISLQVEEQQFVVIIGSNGSGKTTLLNLIAGTLHPDQGSVLWQGIDFTAKPDFDRSRWIARVFQDPLMGTAPDLSILENFRLASLRTQRKKLMIGINRDFRRHVADAVSVLQLGLESKLDTLVGKLSGGQRQAITLLMATFEKPGLLLLDEPAAALDPRSSSQVMKLANDLILGQRLTAVLVTHNLRHALDYGNRLIMMDGGKIVHDVAGTQKEALLLNEVQDWFYGSR